LRESTFAPHHRHPPRHRRLEDVRVIVCPVDDAAEPFVVGVIVMPGDGAPDHPGLFLVGGMAVPFEGEVPQSGELRLCAV
jgi:hypothetical protein